MYVYLQTSSSYTPGRAGLEEGKGRGFRSFTSSSPASLMQADSAELELESGLLNNEPLASATDATPRCITMCKT